MSGGHSKGGGVANTIAVMQELMGPARFQQLTDRLPPATQALIKRRVLAVEWIPIADLTPLTEGFFADWCGSDEAKLIEQSRQSCRRDFNTLYRFFLRVLSPAYVLERTAQIFHTYTDAGTLEITEHRKENGTETLRLRLQGYYPCALYAVTTGAYMFEILTLAQAKDVKVRHSNVVVAGGELSCNYEVTFQS